MEVAVEWDAVVAFGIASEAVEITEPCVGNIAEAPTDAGSVFGEIVAGESSGNAFARALISLEVSPPVSFSANILGIVGEKLKRYTEAGIVRCACQPND